MRLATTALCLVILAAPVAAEEPPPVTILAAGNRLVISCDDPEALLLVTDLARMLTRPGAGDGDFTVIRLRHARAADAARLLDECSNGVREQAVQGGRGMNPFMGGFGGVPAPVVTTTRSEGNLRVVADPGTNSLIIQAKPMQLLGIRRLLDQIDVGDSDSGALVRTWPLPPFKYARAIDVAQLLREVYRENVGAGGPEATNGGSSRGRPAPLSIGVDDRSNRLIVACSEKLKTDIEELVNQLESSARDTPKTVKVMRIQGIDPMLVQRAVEAINGRTTPVAQSAPAQNMSGFDPSRMNGMNRGGFDPNGGVGGPGQGGFNPGFGGGLPGVIVPGGFGPPGMIPGGGNNGPNPAGGNNPGGGRRGGNRGRG